MIPQRGEEHPDTLTARHNLAQQIGSQGRYREAEQELRAIWEIQRRPDMLGEEHPSTLAARHNLARQIGNQGRYREAEQEIRAIWEIQRRPDMLGEEHPNCLRTKFWIAKMLEGQNKRPEADAVLNGLDSAYAKHLDADHAWRRELREHLNHR